MLDFIAAILSAHKVEGTAGVVLAAILFTIKSRGRLAAYLRSLAHRFRLWVLEGGDCVTVTSQLAVSRRVDGLVGLALETLVNKYNACRAYVFEFDGFDSRIKPLPWMFCNCAYEKCNQTRKVTCEQERLQHIPLSAIRYWNVELGTKGQIVLHDITEIEKADLESYKILKDQQIRSCYCVVLIDLHGIPFGFVGLDYCSGQESCVRTEDDMQRLKFEAVKIAGAMLLKRNGNLEKSAGKI